MPRRPKGNAWWGLVFMLFAGGAACGGKVVVDPPSGTGGSNSGPGAGGAGGGPLACPSGPLDADVQAMVGKPCATADEVCMSNNGCGGCSVTCRGGVWTSTDANLCYSIGAAC